MERIKRKLLDIDEPVEDYIDTFNNFTQVREAAKKLEGTHWNFRTVRENCECCLRPQYALYGTHHPSERLKELRAEQNEATLKAQDLIARIERGEGKPTHESDQ